jgi:hypothetical protein
MSYGVQIWSVRSVPFPAALPDAEKWCLEGGAWIRAVRDWQIVVSPSLKVLFEDIPEDVAGLLPGICYLTELYLEPFAAPKSAHNMLTTVSRRLAKAAHGIVLNPQADTVVLPSGVKRYRPQLRKERFSILELSWWFTKGPLLTNSGLHEFIELLERMLPEAMPKRYGSCEPPRYLYAETGREHFLGFLREHLDDNIVWYPHQPVAGVYIHSTAKWGATPQGFRANYVVIGVETKVLEQPGWSAGLDRFWRVASQRIRPFYGDSRTLNGLVRMGATYASDIETEFHPVNGSWWKGIPRTLGHATVLGEPYLDLWPSFVEAAQIVDGLAFLSTGDWTTQEDVSGLIGGIPEAIAQRWTPTWVSTPLGGKTINWNREYPSTWPFGVPHVDNRVYSV